MRDHEKKRVSHLQLLYSISSLPPPTQTFQGKLHFKYFKNSANFNNNERRNSILPIFYGLIGPETIFDRYLITYTKKLFIYDSLKHSKVGNRYAVQKQNYLKSFFNLTIT